MSAFASIPSTENSSSVEQKLRRCLPSLQLVFMILNLMVILSVVYAHHHHHHNNNNGPIGVSEGKAIFGSRAAIEFSFGEKERPAQRRSN
ncbi:hypothetical protein TNCV_383961 [Trichonephila clavipes]|nr:hypothetical protein TNCV_383961 [Trichonephila clavipes]